MSDRRTFLKSVSGAAVLPLGLTGCSTGSRSAPELPRLQPIGSPVLDSLAPVIDGSRQVRTDVDRIREHARWLAYDELPFPQMALPFGLGADVERAVDFVMVTNCVNTAFTDFATSVKFQVAYAGGVHSDSVAMTACFKRAIDEGVPILDGGYLAELTRDSLQHLFRGGNIEMPMLDEKLAVLQEVGRTLVSRYGGYFHNFVASCTPRLYDEGKGLLDRLVAEFPRFDDVSTFRGHVVKFYKLAQLGYWGLFSGLKPHGGFRVDDIASMTAFADYIVPVALRVMGILRYSPGLEDRIARHQLIPRDSEEEIEIRANMLYATALMTEEINKLRPPEIRIIIPQLDARLWVSYHATHWPHHLTETVMY